jgi:hypothetical protein
LIQLHFGQVGVAAHLQQQNIAPIHHLGNQPGCNCTKWLMALINLYHCLIVATTLLSLLYLKISFNFAQGTATPSREITPYLMMIFVLLQMRKNLVP